MIRSRRVALVLFLSAAFSVPHLTRAAQQQYDSGDPSADEQYALELINRARANPTAEGQRLGININEGLPSGQSATPQPPVAMNKILLGTARAHSQDMYTRKYFEHTNPDGKDPFERMNAAGYNFNSAGENIAAGSNHTAASLEDILMVDKNYPGRGHRVNLLSTAQFTDWREIGVGYYKGATPIVGSSQAGVNGLKDFITEDFGRASAGPFAVGVIYTDSNNNNFYDIGEGMSGVTITPDTGGFFAVTGTAGGFAFPVGTSGTITLTASGGGLAGPIMKQVTLTGENVKVDFLASAGAPVAPTITSALTASGTVNSNFTYTIAANGTQPIAFSTSALPAGLTLNGATISGTPTQAGQSSVTLTAMNAQGSDNKTLTISINAAPTPPAITSPLAANGVFGVNFSYTITASGSTPITYTTLGLPAGLVLSGDTISGVPMQGGQFVITLKASNANGNDLKTMTLTIAPPVSNSKTDTDADGFPDELETALGTAANDAASTPFGIAAGAPQALTMTKLQIKLNFAKGNLDSVAASGTLPVPAGFVLAAGQIVVLDVGGVIHSFTLSAKGAGGDPKTDSIKVRLKPARGAVGPQALFTAKFTHASLGLLLADEGLLNTTVTKSALTVPVIVLFNQQNFAVARPVLYTAHQNKTGMAK